MITDQCYLRVTTQQNSSFQWKSERQCQIGIGERTWNWSTPWKLDEVAHKVLPRSPQQYLLIAISEIILNSAQGKDYRVQSSSRTLGCWLAPTFWKNLIALKGALEGTDITPLRKIPFFSALFPIICSNWHTCQMTYNNDITITMMTWPDCKVCSAHLCSHKELLKNMIAVEDDFF